MDRHGPTIIDTGKSVRLGFFFLILFFYFYVFNDKISPAWLAGVGDVFDDLVEICNVDAIIIFVLQMPLNKARGRDIFWCFCAENSHI